MPTTKADVEELRGILRHVESGSGMTVRERMLFDSLTRAVSLLAEGLAPTITTWVLGALKDSGHWNEQRTRWFIDDADLYHWAMEQITEHTP